MLVYFLATGAAAVGLVMPRTALKSSGIGFLWVGLVLHVAALVVRAITAGHFPVTCFSESLSLLGVIIVAGFLALELQRPVGALTVVISPLAFALTLAAYAFHCGATVIPPNLQSALLPVHVLLAILGYALFSLAFAVSLVYLVQERRLKSKRAGARLQLPPLEVLDRLSYRFLTWGLSLFTLAIASGIVWAHLAWGRFWFGEPRLVGAVLTWVVYATVYQGRITAGLRGRRAATLTIFGFAMLVCSLLGVNLLMPGRHGGTYG
jgi:cytochrome c-type biogenesis protein CcsB